MSSIFQNHATKLRSSFFRFFGHDKGTIATSFALSLVPLLATAGVAIDYNRTLDASVKMQAIADAASLAGASFAGTPTQQVAIAAAYLATQEVKLAGISYTKAITTPTGKVQVILTGQLNGSLLPILFQQGSSGSSNGSSPGSKGHGSLNVRARSVYKDNVGGLVCMLTLNATADSAMYFSGSGDITATNCGFQSNSSDLDQALHLQGSAKATADFFHAVGGWDITGNRATFSTPPKSGADVFSDPFQLDPVCPAGNGTTITADSNSATAPTSLADEIYKDITVRNNKYATFTPGTHFIKGEINMTGGLLSGTGVTLILCGPNAKINMNGGDFRIQAPTTGIYKGFAVIGNGTATTGHELQGGANSFVRGIFYTPKAGVTISGNSDFNVDSKYFSIIADTIKLTGSGKVNIGVDAAAYSFDEPAQLRLPTIRNVWLEQ